MSLRKACAPCRNQKLRCNAKDAGMPCGRCLDRRIPGECVLTPRRRRRRNGEVVGVPDRDYNDGHLVPVPPSVLRSETATNSKSSGAVPRGQFHLQLYSELTALQPSSGSNDLLDSESPGQEIVAYPGSTDLVTILGELKGTPSRLVRVVVADNQNGRPTTATSYTDQEDWQSKIYRHSIQGLGEAAIQFLSSEHVFDVPPKHVCDDLIKLYFDHCHHLNPVIDPVAFIRTYLSGDLSLFLIYAILANAIPVASSDVLSGIGFSDCFTAQRAFTNRASHAFNFDLERSNLRLVQGSLILTSAISVYGCYRDTDYWLYNAIRIASTMGLHRRDSTHGLDQKMQRLCRRIWWIIYTRETIHWALGIKNTRLHMEAGSALVDPLVMDDWDNDDMVEEVAQFLPLVHTVHKQYTIQLCRLCEPSTCVSFTFDEYKA
ncbi:fungal-specific transcription factor domain-containing protein, partial [Coniochaeta sp. 2T2.1]